MRSVGIAATALVCAVAIVGVALGVRSIPDIQRYLKMRRM